MSPADLGVWLGIFVVSAFIAYFWLWFLWYTLAEVRRAFGLLRLARRSEPGPERRETVTEAVESLAMMAIVAVWTIGAGFAMFGHLGSRRSGRAVWWLGGGSP